MGNPRAGLTTAAAVQQHNTPSPRFADRRPRRFRRAAAPSPPIADAGRRREPFSRALRQALDRPHERAQWPLICSPAGTAPPPIASVRRSRPRGDAVLIAHVELDPAWRQVLTELRQLVGDSTYDIWLRGLTIQSWEGGQLIVGAPHATEAWVARRFSRALATAARRVAGSDVEIVFCAGTGAAGAAGGHGRTRPVNELASGSPLNPRYSFEQFIVGESNRLAHAASLAVAELPGQAYNPLFVHALPGLGKTHLLHAIGNYVKAFGGACVRYTTVESFTNQFITALGSRSLDHFKRAYRDADVLLIDDVQFLASKAKTEEEFFHTFNALYETGRQLVVTCDRLPRQLVSVEQRLRERFEAGLVADIRPPDFASRVAILRKRAAVDRISVTDPGVLELIAERVTDNVRRLEGALIAIVAHHSLTAQPIDLALAGHVLDQIKPTPKASTTIAAVQTSVASHYEVTVDELVSTSRAARVAWPRQIALHLARELTGASLQEIGEAFGGRNHATVLHAGKRVSERLKTDPDLAGKLSDLSTTLRGQASTESPDRLILTPCTAQLSR